MPLEGIPTNPPSGSFYNALADPTQDPTVPELIDQTNDLVESFLNANKTFAEEAVAGAMSIIEELRAAVLPPALPDPPQAPSIITSFSAALGLGMEELPDLGTIGPDMTGALNFTPEDVEIPDLTGELPVYVPTIDSLAIPEAPVYVAPARPAAPALVDIGEAPPAPTFGTPPAAADITLPVYVPPILPVFNDDAPTFDALPPEPVIGWTEPVYQSDIQDRVKAVLTEMLDGGTGLPADVEAAIWERGRAREVVAGNSKVATLLEEWANRGFSTPQGYMDGAIFAARDESEKKQSDLSREVMVKQADLEQTNRNFAVEKGIAYEQVFTALFLSIVDRNFQIAKFTVETAVTIYNMRVTAFNVEQSVFAQRTERQRILLESALTYIKAFEAMTSVEKSKADINVAQMQTFSALVKAKADTYDGEIKAMQAKADGQKHRMEIFKAEIEGMVGDIQGQRAGFEAYGERVRGEAAKASLEEANARVYDSRVRAFATEQDLFFKRADVQLQSNKQELEWLLGRLTQDTNLHGVELQRIQANLAAYQQGTTVAVARFNADATKEQANLQAQLEISRLGIAKYQALLEQWRVRSGEIIQMANIQAESLRAAAQVNATLAAGAMAGTHVSAGISASAGASKSHGTNISNTSSQSNSVSESTSYGIIHNFQHRV